MQIFNTSKPRISIEPGFGNHVSKPHKASMPSPKDTYEKKSADFGWIKQIIGPVYLNPQRLEMGMTLAAYPELKPSLTAKFEKIVLKKLESPEYRENLLKRFLNKPHIQAIVKKNPDLKKGLSDPLNLFNDPKYREAFAKKFAEEWMNFER